MKIIDSIFENLKETMTINAIRGIGLAALLFSMLSCSTSKKVTQNLIPGIDITFTSDQVADSVFVTITPIPTDTTLFTKEYVEASENGRTEAYAVKDRKVHIFPDLVPSVYKISCDYYAMPSYYMRSSDHLDVSISSLSKGIYKTTGGIYSNGIPYSDEFYKLRSKLFKLSRYKLTDQELDSLSKEMNLLIDKIMAESHPETATRVVTLLDVDFAPYAFEKLPDGSQNTLYYTFACAMRNTGARSANQEQMIQESVEISAPVPEITLNSLDGQTFNISSLRSKWVILDFWVSWCAPCRKGFEKMKKLYAENSDKFEIVGISCGDQEETWKKAVEELELPWTNLLAPSPESNDGTVAGYPVTAYPTKIIIDPNGRLCDYIIGEDEGFYSKFENMIQ